MIVARRSVVIFLIFFCCLSKAQAQVITAGNDSIEVSSTPADTLSRGIFGSLKSWDKPSRAALYSAIIPGAGQFYNKSYWKIPIIYTGGVTIGYFFNKWHKLYLSFRSSYEVRISQKPLALPDQYAQRFPAPTYTPNLVRARDEYRRYRDYNIIFAMLLYGLNVSEAYVDAHLKGFDISDELSMRFEPTIITGPGFGYTPGFAVKLNLKKQ
ncbi:hypothetical protein AHMF7605_07155 [Adhaeribacter arboris]|uniref:DUF5683 domain-containing protein n=1 Tax=Adhaeribacter arboris TaxID=2072846 RepID=A0A2T2YCU9_9BACT|nr:DUF5683 domain-containing protein [Adhaeribacter arboris]PSR53323.1 hypothetical protein AHMF7605_07155 [Adhaeribacter arboris]